jgi:hypothetical protein
MEPMEHQEQYMMCIHLLDLVRLPWLPLVLWMLWLLVGEEVEVQPVEVEVAQGDIWQLMEPIYHQDLQ